MPPTLDATNQKMVKNMLAGKPVFYHILETGLRPVLFIYTSTKTIVDSQLQQNYLAQSLKPALTNLIILQGQDSPF